MLNATGPWVDAVCRLAGDPAGPLLQPTKGVHVVAADRGLPAAFLLLHPADGRVFFVIPWLGKTLIGTTDTLGEEAPDNLSVTPADVDYLLARPQPLLSAAAAAGDLLGSFVGLRPLIRSSKDSPSAISREFRVFESPSGLVSVAGGKYTTYRRMAEVITDTLARRLGHRRPGRTRHFPLDGAPRERWRDFEPAAIADLLSQGLPEATAWHLVHRYGRHAADVAAYAAREPALAQPVTPEEPDILAEFAYQRDHEMALQPADHLLRRTRLGLFHPHLLQSFPKIG